MSFGAAMYPLRHDLYEFPSLRENLYEGLIQIGGEINFDSILVAYSQGIFPWFSQDDPVMWFCPLPRLLLFPEQLKISKSLRSFLKHNSWSYSIDKDFSAVMLQCKQIKRKGQRGSWIHGPIQEVFFELHEKGLAHSIEIWDTDQNLIGGLYGLAIGHMFCGESMFSTQNNASKVALKVLCDILIQKGFRFIDCQQDTPHMRSMGGQCAELSEFQSLLLENSKVPIRAQSWFQEETLLYPMPSTL